MFKIYGLHTPMFVKTVLAAEELGVDYQVVPVDLMKGETKSPEHLVRHPFGKVPVLEHKGQFLFESNAIVRYLGSMAQSELYPQDSFERAKVDQWIEYFAHQPGRWCTSIWFQKCIAPKYFNEELDAKIVADAEQSLLEVMPTLNTLLGQRDWIAGDKLSLADVVAFCLVMGYRDAEIRMNDFPNFEAWFQRYSTRPTVQRILEKWY
jgi:glutathione S-transferase